MAASRLLIPLAVVAALAAQAAPAAAQGCDPARPAVAHHAGALALDPQPADAPLPCMSFTGNAIEAATIGVTDSGNVFFASIEARPDGVRTLVDSSVIARSTDGGGNWENVTPGGLPVSLHGSLSTWLTVNPDTNRLWYATPTAPCGGTVSWSDDDGASWGTHPNVGCPAQGAAGLIEGPAPAGTDQPVGYPHVVYYCANAQDGDESVLFCHKSLDGGRSWRWVGSTPDEIPPEEGCSTTALRSTRLGEVDSDGVLYFPTYSCDDRVLGLAVSDDQGASWTRSKLIETEIQDLYPPALAIDADGNLYLAWKGPGGLPHVAVSTDRGETFGQPLMLAAPGVGSIKRLGIVARDPGHILVTYLGTSDGGASFDAYMTESRTALDAEPVFWSATVNHPATSVLDADASETYGDRMQFLRGNIAPDGTPWGAFHCFDTELCPGERLGIAGRLSREAG